MVNNKKNLFQQMFGLVTSHTFSFFFFRFFRVKIKKYIRRITSFLFFYTEHRILKLYLFLEYPFRRFRITTKKDLRGLEKVFMQKFNCNFSDLSFSFSVGSLFLILFKLLFRVGGINQPIVINCLILLFFTYLAYRFVLIDYVREYLMRFWMLVLGERFYFQKLLPEDLNSLMNFYYEEELVKTPKFTPLNYFFQYFLYFLIFIRLLIISETFLFILFNFFLTSLLLSNKYLILSSILSLILSLSKFTFHLADYTVKDFFKTIQPFVNLTVNETLKISRENIIFITMLAIRFLSNEIYCEFCIRLSKIEGSPYLNQTVGKKIYDNVFLQKYLARKCFERNIFIPTYREYCALYFSSEFVDAPEAYKMIMMHQFFPNYLTYDWRMRVNYIKHQEAVDWDYLYGEKIELKEQDKELREERKNGADFLLLNFFKKAERNSLIKILLSLFLIIGISYLLNKEYNEEVLQAWRTIFGQISFIRKMQLGEADALRTMILERNFPRFSKKADNHTKTVVVTDNEYYEFTDTTRRDPDTPDLGKVPVIENYSVATTGTVEKINPKLNLNQIGKLMDKYEFANPLVIEKLTKNNLILISPKQRNGLLKELNPSTKNVLEELQEQMYFTASTRVQHESDRLTRLAAYNPNASLNVIKESFYWDKAKLQAQINHANFSLSQKEQAAIQLRHISLHEKIILPILPNLDLPKHEAAEFLNAFKRKKILLAEIQNYPDKPWFNIEMKVLSELDNKPVKEIQYGYSNLHYLSKNHGGIGNLNSKTKKQRQIEEDE